MTEPFPEAASDLLQRIGRPEVRYRTRRPAVAVQNRTGKMAPEHKRLNRYATLTLGDILALPVAAIAEDTAHLYLWVPNALLPEGLRVLAAWGFAYKSNIVWHKIRKDGGPDGRGVGFYFRNTTRTDPVRRQGQARPHAGARPPPGEYHQEPQAGAFAQARRSLRSDRVVLAGPLPRIVRPWRARWLDHLGQPGRRVFPGLADVRQPLAGGNRRRRAGEGLIMA
jgi:hypothetical protein